MTTLLLVSLFAILLSLGLLRFILFISQAIKH